MNAEEVRADLEGSNVPSDQHGPIKAGVVFESARRPVVIFLQPLYGHVPPAAHGNQQRFVLQNTALGWLHWNEDWLGAYVDEARNSLVKKVLKTIPEATHVLFVDQDMMLPMETIECLLSNKVDVVSGTYFGKDPDATIVAFESMGPTVRLQDFDTDGIIQVAGVGMGCCLITVDLLKRMREHFQDQLWFQCDQKKIETDEGNSIIRTTGEDAHFCYRCREMGVPIYLDGRVLCHHLMDGAVGYEHWKLAKERKALCSSGNTKSNP
jgi:hypothetical protein